MMSLENQQQQETVSSHSFIIINNNNKNRVCSHCESTVTWACKRVRKNDGKTTINMVWHRDGKGGWLCHRCNGNWMWQKRMLAGELGDDMEVMKMPLNLLRKKMPTVWKSRDEIDLLGHLLDIISKQQDDHNTIITMRIIRDIVGLKHQQFKRFISILALSNLVTIEAHQRLIDRHIVKITPEGTRFVRLYRRMLGLISAWLN